MNENSPNENDVINYDRYNRIQAELNKARELKRSIEMMKLQQQAGGMTAGNAQENNMSQSASQTQDKGKARTLNNGHSILGDNDNRYGFINILIMALLVGFAGGAIMTAVYIFTALGNVTVSL